MPIYKTHLIIGRWRIPVWGTARYMHKLIKQQKSMGWTVGPPEQLPNRKRRDGQ